MSAPWREYIMPYSSMRERAQRMRAFCSEWYSEFTAWGKQFWWIWAPLTYTGAAVTDRLSGWAKGYLSDFTYRVLERLVFSSLLFPALLIGILAVVAFIETKKPDKEPEWINKIIETDNENLGYTQHIDGSLQEGHVSFCLDTEGDPNILFTFTYVNASIYTIKIAPLIEGVLQLEHKPIVGNFKLISPNEEVQHSRKYTLQLKYEISTDAAEKMVRKLIEERDSLYISLDLIKVTISAKEGRPTIRQSRIAFSPQFARRPYRGV